VTELDAKRSCEVERHLERVGADTAGSDAYVARVFEVAGLGPDAVAALSDLADSTGLVVRRGDGGLLVGGRPDTLAHAASELDERPAFEPLAEAIRE
jgi:hypothetical protein